MMVLYIIRALSVYILWSLWYGLIRSCSIHVDKCVYGVTQLCLLFWSGGIPVLLACPQVMLLLS